MKNLKLKQAFYSFAYFVVTSLIFAVHAVAQNASDSDLSNSAGTNKNWHGAGWFIGVVLILVLVVVFTLGRRRKSGGNRQGVGK